MGIVSLDHVVRQVLSRVEDPEDGMYGDLNRSLASCLKVVLEAACETEVEQRLGCKLYERNADRVSYRNGYRERTVQTSYSTFTIQVPRIRNGGYQPSIFESRCRAVSGLESWIADAFYAGISPSQLSRAMEQATGLCPSPGLMKRVQERLDRAAKAFKERRLTHKYDYLYLDAAWVKDLVGDHAGTVCILTAVGITPDGEKQILGFERTPRENASSWRGFIQRLKERGMDVSALKLVISDEHEGLKVAIQEVLGDVDHQLCWAHRVRNLRDHVAKEDFSSMLPVVRKIYKADNRASAIKAFCQLKADWQDKYPRVIQSWQDDLRSLLAFYSCPSLHHEYIRTSNPIERVFLELRRRRFGCGAFANTKACDRLLYNVYQFLNQRWRGKSIWEIRRRRIAKANAANIA